MTKSKNTALDQLLDKLKNNKFIAFLLIMGIIVIAISEFTDALYKVGSVVGIFRTHDRADLNKDMRHPDSILIKIEPKIDSTRLDERRTTHPDSTLAKKEPKAHSTTRNERHTTYPDSTFVKIGSNKDSTEWDERRTILLQRPIEKIAKELNWQIGRPNLSNAELDTVMPNSFKKDKLWSKIIIFKVGVDPEGCFPGWLCADTPNAKGPKAVDIIFSGMIDKPILFTIRFLGRGKESAFPILTWTPPPPPSFFATIDGFPLSNTRIEANDEKSHGYVWTEVKLEFKILLEGDSHTLTLAQYIDTIMFDYLKLEKIISKEVNELK